MKEIENKSEFRLYGRLNSNYFNLVSGKKEPQQTKGLGFLLSKSPKALEIFLRLLFPGEHIKKLLDLRCVIDCEARQRLGYETNNSKRADIVIRFFDGLIPYRAIVIEAKGWDKKADEKSVTNQVIDYCDKFEILKDFKGEITAVTLTANPILSWEEKYVNVKRIINITWIELVNKFLYKKSRNKFENKFENNLIEDYCNYLLNIESDMKFYETEVLSIPAGNTIDLIEDNSIGIYECPNKQEDENKKRDGHPSQKKMALYLSFREGKGGISRFLYKVSDVVVMKFGDNDAIEALGRIDESYVQRVKNYIEKLPSLNKDTEKRVFFLDFDKSIKLPHPCKPGAAKTQGPVNYELHEFFKSPNGKLGNEEVVILRRKGKVDDEG